MNNTELTLSTVFHEKARKEGGTEEKPEPAGFVGEKGRGGDRPALRNNRASGEGVKLGEKEGKRRKKKCC